MNKTRRLFAASGSFENALLINGAARERMAKTDNPADRQEGFLAMNRVMGTDDTKDFGLSHR